MHQQFQWPTCTRQLQKAVRTVILTATVSNRRKGRRDRIKLGSANVWKIRMILFVYTVQLDIYIYTYIFVICVCDIGQKMFKAASFDAFNAFVACPFLNIQQPMLVARMSKTAAFNVANTRIRWLGNFNIKTLLQSSSKTWIFHCRILV